MSNRLEDKDKIKTQLAASGGVTARAVVVRGATEGQVGLPGATDATQIYGVALDTVSAGSPVDVQTRGNAIVIAAGAIAKGDRVAVSGTAGKVRSAGPQSLGVVAAARGTIRVGIVGIANEAASADGDQISIELCEPDTDLPATAAIYTAGTGGTTANMMCVAGAGGDLGKVVLPGGADVGNIIGVARSTVVADATVIVDFAGTVLLTGAASIIAGAPVSIHGVTGKAKTAAPGAGTNSYLLGFAQTPCSGDAATFYAEISKGVMQG